MSKIQISKYGTQSVNVADILSDDDAMHQIEEIAEARLAEQSEIAALREKLAATEASLAERGRMLETTHRVQRSYRAAVATALAELRSGYIQRADGEGASILWRAATDLARHELDATIAKLDLPEAPAPCTWTPDDDGNYATGCDGLFVILEGTPAENKMAYCCYCGKPIQEQPK